MPDSGARATAIWGEDSARTVKVAAKSGIESVMASSEEVVAESDLVFVMTRHGGLHLDLARLAVDARKPVFVDKLLAATSSDAIALVSAVEGARVPMVSFSSPRYCSDTVRFGEALRAAGPVRYASYSGPVSRTSPYSGIVFSAIHSVELMLHHHGVDVAAVRAVEHPEGAERSNIVVTCDYADGTLVTLGLVGEGAYQFLMVAYGRDEIVEVPLVARDYYQNGVQEVLAVLRGENPSNISHDKMVRAVQMCEAIELSLSSGGPVVPRELE